jgi:hypothetical protein
MTPPTQEPVAPEMKMGLTTEQILIDLAALIRRDAEACEANYAEIMLEEPEVAAALKRADELTALAGASS